MVFVPPPARIARHRRIAVLLRRHLDRLLGPLGYTYESTDIEKTHARLTYARGEERLVVEEVDHHGSDGATYTLRIGERSATFRQESEVEGLLPGLIA